MKRKGWTTRRHATAEHGQSLVEFAFVMPILAMVLFALADLGFMLNDQVAIVNAARNGARVAAVTNGDSTAVTTAVSHSANAPIRCALGNTTISSTVPSGTQPPGTSWTVTVDCVYTPITPLGSLFALFGGSSPNYTITQAATMKDANCLPPSCQ